MHTPVVFEDHNQAYRLWQQLQLKADIVLHFDAHLDAVEEGCNPDILQLLRNAPLTADLEAYFSPYQLPGTGVTPANYLYFALSGDSVGHLFWIIPPHLASKQLLIWARAELSHWMDLSLEEYKSLKLVGNRVEGQIKNRGFTLCTLADLPVIGQNAVLDLDLDFFIDARDNFWITPGEFQTALQALKIKAASLALSSRGGYTLTRHRPFAAELAGLEPDALPPYADNPLDRALHFLHKRNYQLAEFNIMQALHQEPWDFVRFMQSAILVKRGKNAEARAVMQEIAVKHPGNAYLWYMLGNLADKPEQACAYYRASLEIRPDAAVLDALAAALQELGELESAARMLRHAIALKPGSLKVLNRHKQLAELYLKLGKPAYAQAEWENLRAKDVTGFYKIQALLNKNKI